MITITELYKKYEEVINYLITGALGTIVNLIIKWILLFTLFDSENSIEVQISIIIAWLFSIIFAYITNRKFVFKSKNSKIIKESIIFLTARITTLLLEMIIIWLFVTYLEMNSHYWIVFWTIFSQILVIIMNYIFSKLFVFKIKDNKQRKQN